MVDDKVKPAGPSRLWRIVLVVSLALNLAVVGLIGGSLVSGNIGAGPPRSFDLGIGPVARALSPEERRSVGRSLRQDRGLRDVDLRGRGREMMAVLTAEPFDPDAMSTVLAAQSQQVADLQASARNAFVETIAGMTPARRAEFAEQVLNELSKDRPRNRSRDGGRD